MTTEQQAFVLFLSDELLKGIWVPNMQQNEAALRARAAHELRRLHAQTQALIVENETLHAENETLRAGYDAARLEIASLQERVQQLGQLARDVNARRVTELEARIAELEAQLEAIGAGGVEPLRKRECLHQITEPQVPLTSEQLIECIPDDDIPRSIGEMFLIFGSAIEAAHGITAAQKGGQYGTD